MTGREPNTRSLGSNRVRVQACAGLWEFRGLHVELSQMRSGRLGEKKVLERTVIGDVLERLNTAHAFFEALFAAYFAARFSLPFALRHLVVLCWPNILSIRFARTTDTPRV